jgi:tRNA threonylcarbamoyladenosine biosynthesis protein TsaE
VRLDADELSRFGEALGRSLRAAPATVIGFSGELGTGKTTLVQAICRGLGVTVPATSPTYALVHQYRAGERAVYHIDCYRLKTPGEARDLGFEDIMRDRGTGGSGAIVLIEWPERAGSWAPPLDQHFRLAYDADAGHRVLEEL